MVKIHREHREYTGNRNKEAETAPGMVTGPGMDLVPGPGPGPDSEIACDDVQI